MPTKKLKTELCDQCDGCGWYEGGKTLMTFCRTCNGTGEVVKKNISKKNGKASK